MQQYQYNSRNSPENHRTINLKHKYLSLSLSLSLSVSLSLSLSLSQFLLFMLHWDLLDPLKLLVTNRLLISTINSP